jgi:hypothetical protein
LETNRDLCLSILPYDPYLVIYTHLHVTSFIHFERCTIFWELSFAIKEHYFSFIAMSNMDGHKLLQMFLDNESLKLEPKERRLTITVNMSNIGM